MTTNKDAGREEFKLLLGKLEHAAMGYAQDTSEHTSRRLNAARDKVMALYSDTVPRSELEAAKADCDRYMFAAMHCKVILPDGNTCHSKEQFDKAMQEHQS